MFLVSWRCFCTTAHSVGFGAQRIAKFRGHSFDGPEFDDPDCPGCEEVQEIHFKDQILDHFAPRQQQQTWDGHQRIFVNRKFWDRDGKNSTSQPLFLYIGGEGPESKSRLTKKSFLYQLADKHGALMVSVEHRFYGESYPTSDMTSDNLKHLSSAQALADLARALVHVAKEHAAESALVVAFGGSYPGNLAAWARLKYPHLVHASVASSAPLRAELEFPEYLEVVGRSLQYYGGDTCYAAVGQAVAELAEVLHGGSPTDKAAALAALSACAPDAIVAGAGEDAAAARRDTWVLLSNLVGNFQGTVQYNLEKEGKLTVADVCDAMALSDDAHEQFVKVQAMYLKENNETCVDSSWDKMIGEMKNSSFDGKKAGRQWTYQTCNEFGYFQTASSPDQPFYPFAEDLDLTGYLDICSEAFGISELPDTEWTNYFYGGVDIDEENILFVNGNIDPWHILGLYSEDIGKHGQEADILYIDGTAHCADMHGTSSPGTQLPALIDAQKAISSKVDSWILNSSDDNIGASTSSPTTAGNDSPTVGPTFAPTESGPSNGHHHGGIKMGKTAFVFTLIFMFIAGLTASFSLAAYVWRRQRTNIVHHSILGEGYREL